MTQTGRPSEAVGFGRKSARADDGRRLRELKLFRMEQKATPQKMVRWHIKLKNGKEYNGSTLFGEYRNAANHIVRLPDFFHAEGFQV